MLKQIEIQRKIWMDNAATNMLDTLLKTCKLPKYCILFENFYIYY